MAWRSLAPVKPKPPPRDSWGFGQSSFDDWRSDRQQETQARPRP
jgi:hypothetical protein